MQRPKGDWFFSQRFAEVDCALAWHLKPSEFFESDPDDQALMLQHYLSRAQMAGFEQAQREQQMEQDRRSARRR